MQDLMARVREQGQSLGLGSVGVCTVEPFSDVEGTMRRRLASGLAGRLRFTYRDPRVATDVRASFPWAARLVVGAAPYVPEAGTPDRRPGRGRVARFAVEDFYPLVRRPLEAIARLLISHGYEAAVLSDDHRLVDRAAAVRAGVGWWGKNSMVLAPRFGPWLLLGSVVTSAPLPPTPPMRRDCGSCEACLPACPTGALVSPGVLDATKCLAYWAQTPGILPLELREPMGDRIYGCDDCLEACPAGRRLVASGTSSRGTVDLSELLTWSDEELIAAFGHFYIPRRQPRFLRRNALVALGNTGRGEHVGLLSGYLGHPDWLLRAHAAWALRRIGTPAAERVLRERTAIEQDERVLAEIRGLPEDAEISRSARSSAVR